MFRAVGITTLLVLGLASCKKDKPAQVTEKAVAPVEARAMPQAIIYAASTQLRIVDAAQGAVVSSIEISQAINAIAFPTDGARGFVATAGGVYRVDAKARVLAGQLTSSPARHVALSENGAKVFVLEHDVIVAPDGTRDIKPFRLKTLDAATGKVVDHEEIGQRILFALPSEGGRYHLILTEAGEVIVGVAGTPLAEGRKLELVAEPLRVRPYVAVYGGHAYVPVEGEPARVFDVDLATGDSVAIGLGRNIPLRGMAVTPDGSTLIINAIREVILVDRTGRAIKQRMELPAPHQGVALSPDGEFAFLAQTIDGTGGAVGIVELAPLSFRGKVHLDDISPWTIAVAP